MTLVESESDVEVGRSVEGGGTKGGSSDGATLVLSPRRVSRSVRGELSRDALERLRSELLAHQRLESCKARVSSAQSGRVFV